MSNPSVRTVKPQNRDTRKPLDFLGRGGGTRTPGPRFWRPKANAGKLGFFAKRTVKPQAKHQRLSRKVSNLLALKILPVLLCGILLSGCSLFGTTKTVSVSESSISPLSYYAVENGKVVLKTYSSTPVGPRRTTALGCDTCEAAHLRGQR